MSTANVLVVDDELFACRTCQDILGKEGHAVEFALSGGEALEVLDRKPFDLVLTDLKMPAMDGIELLGRIKKRSPNVPVIVITGYATVETAVEAMRKGAYDYVSKPFTPDTLRIVVRKALENSELVREVNYLRQTQRSEHEVGHVIGKSPAMRRVYALVEKVAPSDTTVLIGGESGTGKEVVARAIHYKSRRSNKQFIAVDCATLAKELFESELFGHVKGSFTGAIAAKPGIFEVADGGSLFLDEIANISPETQGKLLRVLEQREFKRVGDTRTKKVDVRIIAATNKDLKALVEQGVFREDLFYRLNVFPVCLPPLRERKEDIPVLSQHFLREFSRTMRKRIRGFTADAMQHLVEYDWPGNVRELRNVIERVVIMVEDEVVTPTDLPGRPAGEEGPVEPDAPRTAEELKRAKRRLREKAVAQVERTFLLEALERNEWNVAHAARDTGMDRRNFQKLMRKHRLQVQAPQDRPGESNGKPEDQRPSPSARGT